MLKYFKKKKKKKKKNARIDASGAARDAAMRCVIQRVFSASVTVDGVVISAIRQGLLCLVGVCDTDTEADVHWLERKLLSLRLWDGPPADDPSPDGGVALPPRRWVMDVAALSPPGELLLVSQFTLHARTKNAKPDFCKAMTGTKARPLFDALVAGLRAKLPAERVKEGRFGEMMRVSMEGDGPVTILVDSRNRDECGGLPALVTSAEAAAAGLA